MTIYAGLSRSAKGFQTRMNGSQRCVQGMLLASKGLTEGIYLKLHSGALYDSKIIP